MSSRGITFLELIIAMGIFTFVVFSVGILIPLSQVNSFRNTNRTTALTLADNMMEKIRAINYDDIEINVHYKGSTTGSESPTRPANEGTYYQYPPLPYPSSTVEICYPGQGGGDVISHSVVFEYNVFACYDRDENGIDIESLKKITIDVKWLEPGRMSTSREEEKSNVTLSSKVLKR